MGEGARYFDPPGATFGPGQSRPLTPYKSIAVRPRSGIPMGSKVYISQYKDKGGWFTAADVGGAIQGRHVDVFRSPPASLNNKGQYFPDVRIYVVRRASGAPKGARPARRTRRPRRRRRRAPAPMAAPARPEEPRVTRRRCAATAALALALVLGVAAPAVAASEPAGDATGPLDLINADVAQKGSNLSFSVTTNANWAPSDLAAQGPRSLCVRLFDKDAVQPARVAVRAGRRRGPRRGARAGRLGRHGRRPGRRCGPRAATAARCRPGSRRPPSA